MFFNYFYMHFHIIVDLRTENYFWNFVNPNQIWIVFTLFRYVYQQIEFRSVLNLPENCGYNLKLVWIDKIPKIFLSLLFELDAPDLDWKKMHISCPRGFRFPAGWVPKVEREPP